MRRKKSSMDEHGAYVYIYEPGGDVAGKAGEWHGWGP
jgi:hypothetical protein